MRIRQQAEREIVEATVKAAMARGWKPVAVNYGDDDEKTTTLEQVMEHAFAGDEAHIIMEHEDGRDGWFYIVLGNEGWTVISDYTTNLDEAVQDSAVEKLVNDWEYKLT